MSRPWAVRSQPPMVKQGSPRIGWMFLTGATEGPVVAGHVPGVVASRVMCLSLIRNTSVKLRSTWHLPGSLGVSVRIMRSVTLPLG